MAKKSAFLASVFDDEPAAPAAAEAPAEARPEAATMAQLAAVKKAPGRHADHGGKKPVLIHIPAEMHRLLRQLSVETGEPLTAITERMLRRYLVECGYVQFAPTLPHRTS